MSQFRIFCQNIFTLFALSLSVQSMFGQDIFYPVSKVSYHYGIRAGDVPALSRLGEAIISFGEDGNETLLLEPLMRGASPVLQLTDLDLHKLCEVPVQFLKQEGLEGVVAFPDPSMVDPLSGEDLRESGNSRLRILVWVSICLLYTSDAADEV